MFAKKLTIGLITLLSLFLAVPVSAQDQIEVVNNIGMGNVSVSLISEQYDAETGKNIPWKQDRVVLPGEEISEIVTIKNEGEEAWIRAKLDFTTHSSLNLTESDVKIVDGWERHKDGFFYWKTAVKNGQSVKFIESVTVPAAWDSSKIKKTKFNLNVQTDAVQSKNFTPDFSRDDPWFGTLIETSIYNYTRTNSPTDINFFVAYEGGAEGLIHKGDNFFSNWGTAMPGDSFEDEIAIGNRYAKKVRMYFRTENDFTNDLEKQIKLKIFRGENNIYDGTLFDVRNEMVLADLNQGDNFVLKYSVEIPKELGNAYSLAEGSSKWIFRAEIVDTPAGGGSGKGTGVDTDPYKFAAAATSALAVIIGAAYLLKKTKKANV